MSSDHPEPDVLAAFGRGDLPPPERVAVAEHLKACDTCCGALGPGRNETLATVSPDDPVDSLLQQTNALEFAKSNTPGAFAAASVIEKMQKQNRVVAAICEGQGILATHGVLNGKSVATHAATRDLPAIKSLPIKWKDKDVVIDGKVVTASGPDHAVEFADALLKVMRLE